MSVAGTYKVQVKTPRGEKDGKITLLVDGNTLSGTLENAEGCFEITDGKINGSVIEFITKLKTPIGHQKATVTATIDGNTFSGVAKLPIGSAQIKGIKEE